MNQINSIIKQIFLMATFSITSQVSVEEQNDALNLCVEDWLNVEVTSVAKKAQSLNDAAALRTFPTP